MSGEVRSPAVGGGRAPVVILRCFAGAREAAGTGRAEVEGGTVEEVIAAAEQRFGAAFAAVVAHSRIWVNGQPAEGGDVVVAGDEVAVLPPVSGGSGGVGGVGGAGG